MSTSESSPDIFSGIGVNQGLTTDEFSRYTPSPLIYALLTLTLIAITTRIWTNRNSQVEPNRQDDDKSVPAVPYWIPLLGHIPNMIWDADNWPKSLRNRYKQGIFALNFGGTAHNILYTPGLTTAFLNLPASDADFGHVSAGLMKSVFGLPGNEMRKYETALPDLMACYKHLLSEPSLGTLVERTTKKIKENVISLVTFSRSPVDQTLWERNSYVKIIEDKEGEEILEASLLPLIRDFCAHTANPSLMGSNFLANFPHFFEELWTLDRGFTLIATGLPRWIPITILTRAHIARRNILNMLTTFHSAVEKEVSDRDPGPDWQDLDDVGAFVKARISVYRKHGFSVRARAAFEHSLLWAANANSNPLIFWIINRIYADPKLLVKVREEVEPYVKVVQPEQEFPVPEPPLWKTFDVDGLCNNCPLLKSCYVESLRLDTASWSLKVVKQDFVLQSREKGARPWLLRKGEYAHAAHDLHNTDPNCFEDPLIWKADRHVKYDSDEKRNVAGLGSIRPYGGGTSMCKGRAFAFKECMAFTAAIVALWDIEPANGGEWKMPRHRKATGVYGTGDDTRVRVKRRKLTKRE